MHPALSVIVFTVTSGAGYGLLFWLGILGGFGFLPTDPWIGGLGVGLGLALVTAGLLASTFHLGRPERAWRAISQWRSSWLSREAVAALLGYGPALAFGWLSLDGPHTAGIWRTVALTTSAMAVVTVACTAMIYASLKPIRQWRSPWVVAGYLAYAAASGALVLQAILGVRGTVNAVMPTVAPGILALAWLIKAGTWRSVARDPESSTPESATGLGEFGKVRPLDPPHTGENYLLREMGFRVARSHALRLRRIVHGAAFAGPLALSLAALTLPRWPGAGLAVVAVLLCLLGLLVERWLFFAEARHTVTLYYRGQ